MRARSFYRGHIAAALAAAFFLYAFPAEGFGSECREEIQKNRTATMKAIDKAMRRIRVYAKKGLTKELASAALDVSKRIARIPELSPEGSAFGPKSRIKPEVWDNFDEYKKLSVKSSAAARSLSKVAEAGASESLMPSFAALAKTCGACHKPYRKKKKRK